MGQTLKQLRRLHGTNVREARERKGLTQAQLAKRMGVIQQTVSHWEGGRSAISDAKKLALARILGGDPNEMFPLTLPKKQK